MAALMLLLRNSPAARWIAAGVGGAVALALAYLAFTWWLGDVKDDAADKAIAEERAGGLYNTIISMEAADNAAETIKRSPDARRDECLRHARNPADC